MAMYRKKPIVIDAITFDELVEYGMKHAESINGGVPWAFQYKGHPVTHETNDVYLVSSVTGTNRFCRGDMLITGHDGEVYPCPRATFEAVYEPA